MFEQFSLSMIDIGDVTLRVRHGGEGPPLLLLHGHPQTHLMWHKVAPLLARDFTVIAPDLRGYGQSSKPPSTPDHAPYSKRALAQDAIALMQHFGWETFSVAGHDRGGRVAYRLALDHPEVVRRVAVLDIVPTYEAYRRANMEFGIGYWHWFFLAQPAPFPEQIIQNDPEDFYFRQARQAREQFDPEALADYLDALHDPETIRALCEDYRAGATIDYTLDEADFGARKITAPLLALWGGHGPLDRWYDVLAIWRDWANDVRGRALPCGHYLAEEAPDETYAELQEFFL